MSLKKHIVDNTCKTKANGQKQQNDNTRTAYRRAADKFASWARDSQYSRRDLETNHDIARNALQEYCDYLENYRWGRNERSYSAHTIHDYLAAPCRGLGVGMDEVCKPKRTSDTITRGRNGGSERSQKDRTNDKYSRLVRLNELTGLRRAELGRLRGNDLVTDESGHMCIRVIGGKGGKNTLQRIAPEHEQAVREIMTAHDPAERVFAREEMANKISLHTDRATHAQEMYRYYADKLAHEDGYRERLRSEMMARWDSCHDNTSKRDQRNRREYANMVYCDTPYRLRGNNKQRCIDENAPIVYDRTAMAAVSVFHLSHWRLDVTSTNYLTAF